MVQLRQSTQIVCLLELCEQFPQKLAENGWITDGHALKTASKICLVKNDKTGQIDTQTHIHEQKALTCPISIFISLSLYQSSLSVYLYIQRSSYPSICLSIESIYPFINLPIHLSILHPLLHPLIHPSHSILPYLYQLDRQGYSLSIDIPIGLYDVYLEAISADIFMYVNINE